VHGGLEWDIKANLPHLPISHLSRTPNHPPNDKNDVPTGSSGLFPCFHTKHLPTDKPVMDQTASFISYKKSRFSTRLPTGRLYTQAHFWIDEIAPGLHRIGLTKFATRMLGDLVETGMEVGEGDPVAVGQVIGWIECLKAASDLFCMVDGAFVRENPDLPEHPEWLQKDPYARGWLYEARGTPEPAAVDAEGYAAHLDKVIAIMLGEEP